MSTFNKNSRNEESECNDVANITTTDTPLDCKLSTNFESLSQTLLERKGRFQFILIILLCLNSIIIGINHTITAFHIYVPQFFCRDNETETCGVYVNGTECPSGYVFDEVDDRTLVVEFQLVCNRAWLAPLVNTLYFVGVTLGALVCSSLCDIYGRKKLVIICLYGQSLMAVGQYFAPSLTVFIIFRTAQGFFVQGLQTCSYTLMLEYCPSRYRTIAATYWESHWAIGLGILGAASYFIREWRLLTLVVASPALISLTYVWIFPESIVWLETKGRRKEAFYLIQKIAKSNNAIDIVERCSTLELVERLDYNQKEQQNNHETTNAAKYVEKITLSLIVKNTILRKHILSMICIWFSVTLSYYGILYYLPNLAGQRHLNFEIGASIELMAYVVAYFVLSSFGRRIPMTFYQFANGVLILVIAVLSTRPDGSYNEIWLTIITLVAKGLAVSSFCGMFIYCSELLPTVCRGLGLGLCGFSARCGSLLAPQLISLVPTFIPLSIMSLLLLFTATATIFLPETFSNILPNTISEANVLWSKKK